MPDQLVLVRDAPIEQRQYFLIGRDRFGLTQKRCRIFMCVLQTKCRCGLVRFLCCFGVVGEFGNSALGGLEIRRQLSPPAAQRLRFLHCAAARLVQLQPFLLQLPPLTKLSQRSLLLVGRDALGESGRRMRLGLRFVLLHH